MIFLLSIYQPLFTQLEQHGRHVLCAFIRINRKLAAYITWAAFEQGLSMSWWLQTESVQLFTS